METAIASDRAVLWRRRLWSGALIFIALGCAALVYVDTFHAFVGFPGARKVLVVALVLVAVNALPLILPMVGRRVLEKRAGFQAYLLCLLSAFCGIVAMAPVLLPLPLDFVLLPLSLGLAYLAYRCIRSRYVRRVILLGGCLVFMSGTVVMTAQVPYIKYRTMSNGWDDVSLNENARFLKATLLHAAEASYAALVAALDTQPIPVESDIEDVYLQVPPGALKAMASRLPESAKAQYYDAQMLYPDGEWQDVAFRMRGRNIWHWSPDKPSLRVRLKKSAPIDLQRHINLVNPEDKSMVSNIIGEVLAARLGVLTHLSKPVRVFINGKYFGVYHQTTREDEEMLRANHRVPGPLFVGDNLAPRWDARDFEVSGNPEVLQKFDPLGELVETLYQPMSPEKLRRFWRIMSMEKLAAWDAAMKLAGGVHTDYHHNNLFYYDPRLGRIEPMISDINGHGMMDYPGGMLRYTQPKMPHAKTPINELLTPLMDVALRDPRFLERRNKVLFDALNGPGSVNSQNNFLDEFFDKIDPHVKADRQKASLEGLVFGWFRVPLSNHQYEAAKVALRQWVENRSRYLLDTLSNVQVDVQLTQDANERGVRALVTVSGNAGVTFDPAAFSQPVRADVTFDETFSRTIELATHLSPGIRLTQDPEEAGVLRSGRRSPAHFIVAGEQQYVFLMEDMTLSDVEEATARAFSHNLTGAPIVPQIEKTATPVKAAINPNAIHPWSRIQDGVGDVHFAGGTHVIDSTLYVGIGGSLVIDPGAELMMGPGVSIISEGRTEISGTPTEPVVIRRKEDDRPWGGLLILGENANGSVIRHANISGGTFAQTRTMATSGMVSVYGLDTSSIEHVHLSSNTTSDDTLHVVYGSTKILSSTFSDCFGDCVDLDYVNGDIEDYSAYDARNDGLDLMTSTVRINGAQIEAAGDKGMSVGELSHVEASDLTIGRAVIGIAVKDSSYLNLDGAVFRNNEVALDSYIKNWRYGGAGSLETRNLVFRNNGLNGRIQDDGDWVLFAEELPQKLIQDGHVTLRSDRNQ